MKAKYLAALALSAAALLVLSWKVFGGNSDVLSDDRIEAAFQKSFVGGTYLKDDHIEISVKDGADTQGLILLYILSSPMFSVGAAEHQH